MGTIALILLDRLSAKNTPNSSAFFLTYPNLRLWPMDEGTESNRRSLKSTARLIVRLVSRSIRRGS
jgi:hypothetical protein